MIDFHLRLKKCQISFQLKISANDPITTTDCLPIANVFNSVTANIKDDSRIED